MDFTVYMPILNSVPSKHRAAVQAILALLTSLLPLIHPPTPA
jgi:hypothetical protein